MTLSCRVKRETSPQCNVLRVWDDESNLGKLVSLTHSPIDFLVNIFTHDVLTFKFAS